MKKIKKIPSSTNTTGTIRIRPVWNEIIDAKALSRAIIALVLHPDKSSTDEEDKS